MLRPAILIGCGGSGQKAIRYVRDAVERRIRHAGWQRELPAGWVFLALDTLNAQDSPEEIPLLPQSDFHTISPTFNSYQDLESAVLATYPPARARSYEDNGLYESEGLYLEVLGWRPRPSEVRVPLKKGAGANRAVGRLAGIESLRRILDRPIEKAFEAAGQAGGDLAEISELLGVPVKPGSDVQLPMVVVCASMAGGTGAGIALDVIEIVRNIDSAGAFPSLVLFTPDIFDDASFDAERSSMAGNALALMSETLNAYWDNERQASPLWASALGQPGRGPHATFLVGRRSLRGGDLGDAAAVYKAVGESLANWVTNHGVQERVDDIVTVNWRDNASKRLGGYPFGMEFQTGAVSSFGAATLSVGRDRFERWATDLLAREVLEALAHGHEREELKKPGSGDQPETVRVKELADTAAHQIVRGDSMTSIRQPPTDNAHHQGALSARHSYASADGARAEQRRVESDLRAEFPANAQGSGSEWHSWLRSAAQQRRVESLQRAQAFDATRWGTDMLAATCRAISAAVAESSLPVARHAVERATELLSAEVEALRRDSDTALRQSDDNLRDALQGIQSVAQARTDSPPFDDAVEGLARGIARAWFAERLDMAAFAIEGAIHRVFYPAGETLRQKVRSVNEALERVDEWPRARSGVPPKYCPSSVELPLESHDAWPDLLDDLCREAVSSRTAAALPINAARFTLIAGDEVTEPLLWPVSTVWSPTESSMAVFTCPASDEEIVARVSGWARRPGSRFDRVVSEGLRDYLDAQDPVSGAIREDHVDRLAKLRTQLEAAKLKSAPLVRVDDAMHSQIYSTAPPVVSSEMLVCAPFPFPEGHPAHDIAQQIIGVNNYRLADADVSSVLVSSFLSKPIHPMSVVSFTEPVADAVQSAAGVDANLRASFWLWRRARRLDQFIPLPRAIRQAMIRGFAVGRLCGYVSCDTARRLLVSSDAGPVEFPYPLLTQVETDDVLAGLLESFALAFAFVGVDKQRAFRAYQCLHDLGESADGVHGDLSAWLLNGDTPFERVDHPRAIGDSPEARKSTGDRYLAENLEHLERIAAQPLSGHEDETKPHSGRAKLHVPTREIVSEIINSYRQVKEALRSVGESSVI